MTTAEPAAAPLPTITASPAAPSKTAKIIGWIMGILPVLMLLMSAGMKFSQNKQVLDGFDHLGWPAKLAVALGILELACTFIYLIPKTAVLGAILLTGYLGGAIATHVRIGEGFVGPVVFGILLWGSLYLRDPRLRALIPLRS
ncbi:MAG TPA: DoxX family protein [Verrucomicrobiae bacterium]|nr:DoxX family protein [Verrucomicrobiae bacterium]